MCASCSQHRMPVALPAALSDGMPSVSDERPSFFVKAKRTCNRCAVAVWKRLEPAPPSPFTDEPPTKPAKPADAFCPGLAPCSDQNTTPLEPELAPPLTPMSPKEPTAPLRPDLIGPDSDNADDICEEISEDTSVEKVADLHFTVLVHRWVGRCIEEDSQRDLWCAVLLAALLFMVTTPADFVGFAAACVGTVVVVVAGVVVAIVLTVTFMAMAILAMEWPYSAKAPPTYRAEALCRLPCFLFFMWFFQVHKLLPLPHIHIIIPSEFVRSA